MASEEMSREEKEALLNIRMEQIRKKNAQLQKRYEEVKADKQNAEEISDSFQEKHRDTVEEPRVRRVPPRYSDRQKDKTRFNEVKVPQSSAPEDQDKRRPQRFTEDDGPPPDPSYSFLFDRSREGDSSQDKRRTSRRHLGNYGGKDFENVKSTMEHRKSFDKASPRQPPQSKMEMSMRMTGRERCEYEQWRSERSKIEHDRVNRQKTSSGEWRREWDKAKHSSDLPEEAAPPKEKSPQNRGGGGKGDSGEKAGHGSKQYGDRYKWGPFPEFGAARPLKGSKPNSRNIHIDSDNIKVSLSNDRVDSGTLDVPDSIESGPHDVPERTKRTKSGPRDWSDQARRVNRVDPTNRTWRTSEDRRSTSSREYSSSVSEDDSPSKGKRTNTRHHNKGRDPKNKNPLIEEDVFQDEGKPPRGPKPGNPQPIEQRVYFVPTGLQPLHEPEYNQGDGPQIGDDVPDDASWDDEGSWEEEELSDNEARELSQQSQEVSEATLPANNVEPGPQVSDAASTTAPPSGTTMTSPQSDSHESTPVAEVQDVPDAESELPSECANTSAEVEIFRTEIATEDDPTPVQIPQETVDFPQKTLEFSQEPAPLPQQFSDIAQTPAEVTHQTVESTHDTIEIIQQPAESSVEQPKTFNPPVELTEASNEPVEQAEASHEQVDCVEIAESAKHNLQQEVVESDKTPETEASKELSKTPTSSDECSRKAQDVPQVEISLEYEDPKLSIEKPGEVLAANSNACGEDEVQAVQETASSTEPVPSAAEATDEKSEE